METDSIIIFVLAVLIIMSAYFSATETAFSSLNKIRLKNDAKKGNRKARLALKLSEDYDRLLSTILIGNNIVNIASASLATVIFVKYFGNAGVTISTVVMTVLVLIFGEISPKSMAKDVPEEFAMFSAPILRCFMIILYPVNFLFMQWKRFLASVFKVKQNRTITEEELLTIVDEAQQEGGINEKERELIRSAIEFNDLDVSDVLTPRVDIVGVQKDLPVEDIARKFVESGFSRLPVYEEDIDNIIGVIHHKDFYNKVLHQKEGLADIMKPVKFITGTMKISRLLTLLQQTKSHLAVITDEFGGTEGIVTLEDVIEELVGEIWDEHDEVIEEIKKIGDDTYRIVCTANLDKMMEVFHKEEYECDSTTVSGWVMEQLGKIPQQGDRFTYEDLEVTVSKTDQRRVLEIIVRQMAHAGQEA